jgi:hypothetical protein
MRSFTVILPPAAFTKTSPTVGQIITSPTTTLSWAASTGATSYKYCVGALIGGKDKINCLKEAHWKPTGSATTANISGLLNGYAYKWQVRATNTSGITEADNSTYGYFGFNPYPQTFELTSPTVGQIITSDTTTLSWAPSMFATRYEYCYAKSVIISNMCTPWLPTDTATTANISGLSHGATYYWQVRAINAAGTTYDVNTNTSFTVGLPPAAFTMVSPIEDTRIYGGEMPWQFRWNASQGATSYEYCIYLASGTCVWIDNGPAQTVLVELPDEYKDNQLFWQVRAKNSFGSTVSSSGPGRFFYARFSPE